MAAGSGDFVLDAPALTHFAGGLRRARFTGRQGGMDRFGMSNWAIRSGTTLPSFAVLNVLGKVTRILPA